MKERRGAPLLGLAKSIYYEPLIHLMHYICSYFITSVVKTHILHVPPQCVKLSTQLSIKW